MLFTRLRNYCFVAWYTLRFLRLDFMWVLEALAHRDDLERLILWSRRKRLQGVQTHYVWLLKDVEMRLGNKIMRRPYLTEAAKWFYCALNLLNPPPRYYAKGAGAKYSLRN